MPADPDPQPERATIDDLDRHLAAAGSLERAVLPMGWFMAWAANLHLLSPAFVAEHERLLLRVRYREASGAELVVAAGGRIDAESLSDAGRAFAARHYDDYLASLPGAFDGADPYAQADDWASYDRAARLLTERYMHARGRRRSSGGGLRAGWQALTRWWRRT